VRLVFNSKKYVMYVGGGCLKAIPELQEFVYYTGILVASTFMCLGSFPSSHEKSLGMLGMHKTAADKADLFLAFGVLFNDRVIDVQSSLQGINYLMKKREDRPDFSMPPCNDRPDFSTLPCNDRYV
jgi:thiamine pyrophosphate-dependent acetolactate synthase large subunit-like protein